MLKQFPILRLIIPFIAPYILLFAFYIQLNGEISPGGGFQAGVIFASGIIGLDLVGVKRMTAIFHIEALATLGILGVLIYAATGVISLIFDDNYLNYGSLLRDKIAGQHLGIFTIELGVGLTVASIMCLIYTLLRSENKA